MVMLLPLNEWLGWLQSQSVFWSEIKPKLFGFPVHSLVSILIILFAKAECFDNIHLKKFNHAYVVVQFSLSTVWAYREYKYSTTCL